MSEAHWNEDDHAWRRLAEELEAAHKEIATLERSVESSDAGRDSAMDMYVAMKAERDAAMERVRQLEEALRKALNLPAIVSQAMEADLRGAKSSGHWERAEKIENECFAALNPKKETPE